MRGLLDDSSAPNWKQRFVKGSDLTFAGFHFPRNTDHFLKHLKINILWFVDI